MLKRMHFKNRDEWLAGRSSGLGASNAAAAVGLSKWETNVSLWEHITGKSKGDNLIGNAAVEFGTRARQYAVSTREAV